MGFNRRKMEDQRRTAAEKEAATRRDCEHSSGCAEKRDDNDCEQPQNRP
jgi:hypothetical protein